MFRFAQHDSATCEPERDARQKHDAKFEEAWSLW